MSIKTGIFPQKWKQAKVTPIHKSGDQMNINNYRPISILNVVSKIIEKHVHKTLYCFLTQNELIYLPQSGFRALHSCETALLRLVDIWTKAIDDGQINGILLLDLRKAFDLVGHEILLKKLEAYKCNDTCLKWFESYMSNRNQHVFHQGKLSKPLPVTSGVPQGSILGPLLFLLFMNDMHLEVKGNLDMYADDSTITAASRSIPDVEQI